MKSKSFSNAYLDVMVSVAEREESVRDTTSMSREMFFSEYGFAQLSFGRQTGKTTAAGRFVEIFENSMIIIPSSRMAGSLPKEKYICAAEFLKIIDLFRLHQDIEYLIFDDSGELFINLMKNRKFEKILKSFPNLRVVYNLGSFRCFQPILENKS